MRPRPKQLAAAIVVMSLGAAGPAISADVASLPPMQAEDVVSYISGGIGEDEAAAFKHAATRYPLEMLFVQKARPRDEYLADVRVAVRNRSGNVLLETTAEGPFLLARLPPGKYRIDAEIGGERKQQTVELRRGSHQRAVFVWASADAYGVPGPSSAN